MLFLSGSCIPLKVSLTVMKKVFLFFRVIIEYREYRLPREISRATRFFLLRGGMVHLKVTDENYRRSPLIQGGLEIPVEVTCEMDQETGQ